MCGKAPLFRPRLKDSSGYAADHHLFDKGGRSAVETFVESGGAAAKGLSDPSEKRSFSAHRTAKP